jgi:hypothetical protein
MDMPFDKLPKFLAIAGLSLAIAGATLVYTTYIDRAKEQLKLVDLYSAEIARQNASELKERNVGPEPLGWNYPDCAYDGGKPRPAKCEALLKKIAPIQNAWIDKNNKLGQAEAEARHAAQDAVKAFQVRFSAQDSIFRLQFVLGGIGVLLGAGVSGYGFKGWRDLERAEKARPKRL